MGGIREGNILRKKREGELKDLESEREIGWFELERGDK